jgi:hypothetical protein
VNIMSLNSGGHETLQPRREPHVERWRAKAGLEPCAIRVTVRNLLRR